MSCVLSICWIQLLIKGPWRDAHGMWVLNVARGKLLGAVFNPYCHRLHSSYLFLARFLTSGLSLICVVGSYSRDMPLGHFDRSLSFYFNAFLLSVYLSRGGWPLLRGPPRVQSPFLTAKHSMGGSRTNTSSSWGWCFKVRYSDIQLGSPRAFVTCQLGKKAWSVTLSDNKGLNWKMKHWIFAFWLNFLGL